MERLIFILLLICSASALAEIYVDCSFDEPPTSESEGGRYGCDVNDATLFFASNLAGPVFSHVTDQGWQGGGAAKFYTHTSGTNSYRQLNFGQYSSSVQQNLRYLLKFERANELGGKWHLSDALGGWRTWLSFVGRAGVLSSIQPEISYDNTIWLAHGATADSGFCSSEGYQCCQHEDTWWDSGIISCNRGTESAIDLSDYENEWVCIEIERHSSGTYKVYVWTQDKAFTGLYYELDTVYNQELGNAPAGAYLEGQASGSYFMLDEIVVSDSFIGPPEGFLADGCIDGDSDCDGRISMDELAMFMTAWRQGDVSIAQLMEVIRIWKG
jgi:hypothetical protein